MLLTVTKRKCIVWKSVLSKHNPKDKLHKILIRKIITMKMKLATGWLRFLSPTHALAQTIALTASYWPIILLWRHCFILGRRPGSSHDTFFNWDSCVCGDNALDVRLSEIGLLRQLQSHLFSLIWFWLKQQLSGP